MPGTPTEGGVKSGKSASLETAGHTAAAQGSETNHHYQTRKANRPDLMLSFYLKKGGKKKERKKGKKEGRKKEKIWKQLHVPLQGSETVQGRPGRAFYSQLPECCYFASV